MKQKICSFAGHSEIYSPLELRPRLVKQCETLISQYPDMVFWVGHYGEFDSMAANIIRELKKKYATIKLELVIPYLTKSMINQATLFSQNYDSVFLAEIPETTPKRYQIRKCNEYIINNSNFLIAYVNYTYGGAAKTLSYAQRKKNLTIYNLGTWQEKLW